jgi:hypothetical protein
MKMKDSKNGNSCDFTQWDDYLKNAVCRTFHELNGNSKAVLTESDLKCKLYHYLTIIMENDPNSAVYTEMTHYTNITRNNNREVIEFGKHSLRDLSIVNPEKIEENDELFDARQADLSKGFKHKGCALHVELKFTRMGTNANRIGVMDLSDITKLYSYSGDKRKFVIVHGSNNSNGAAENIANAFENKINNNLQHLLGVINKFDIYVFDRKKVLFAAYDGNELHFKESCKSQSDTKPAEKKKTEIKKVEQTVKPVIKVKNINLVKQAEIAYFSKDYKNAIKLADQSIAAGKDLAAAYEIKAWALHRQGKNEEGYEAAKLGLKIAPEETKLLNIYGVCCIELDGKFKEGKEAFNKAIELNSYKTVYYFNKIMLLDKNGNVSEGDKVHMTLVKVASEIIKDKALDNTRDKMRAYIDRATWKNRQYKPDIIKDAKKARAIYDILPKEEQDRHDLDDINKLLN